MTVVGIVAERPDGGDANDLDVALEMWEERLVETQYDPRFTTGALRLRRRAVCFPRWAGCQCEARADTTPR